MIEVLVAHGFYMWSKTCSGCPGPKGTKWRLPNSKKWSITEYTGKDIFYVTKNGHIIYKGKAHELDEYIKKHIILSS